MQHKTNKKVDSKEFDLPETLFVRSIEDRVFQGIVQCCISKIHGVTLSEGSFIDNLLSGESSGSGKSIFVEQDNINPSISIKVEVNISYGVPIPAKAEEIQATLSEEITRLTGLHVSCVQVVFKNLSKEGLPKKSGEFHPYAAHSLDHHYSDEL